MSNIGKVTVGQPIGPELRASTWNSFIDAANFAKKQREVAAKRRWARQAAPADTILVRNDTGATVAMFDVVGLDSPAYKPTGNENDFKFRIMFSAVAPTSDHHGRFGIAAEPIADGGFGLVNLYGMTACRIDELEPDILLADVDPNDSTRLMVTPNGTAQLLWTASPAEADEGLETQGGDTLITQAGDTFGDHVDHNWAIARLGVGADVTYAGKTDEEIAADGTGTVSIWLLGGDTGFNVEAQLDWMHGDEVVSSGKEVLVKWFHQEQVWRIVAAECED